MFVSERGSSDSLFGFFVEERPEESLHAELADDESSKIVHDRVFQPGLARAHYRTAGQRHGKGEGQFTSTRVG